MAEALIFMLGISGICGAVLGMASRFFHVEEDPRIAEVEAHLAGANCGACGYGGCAAAARAVVAGEAKTGVCIPAGAEAAVRIAEVMGVDAETVLPFVALNNCEGGDRAAVKYHYTGINTCRGMASLYGGRRECAIGCIGLGDCVGSCPFDAMHMGPDGFPIVDEDKCTGCGTCVRTCPKSIIELTTMTQRLFHLNCENDCLAPCSQTCPAEINIPRYISKIRKEDFEGAVNTIRERNPLLLTCGRVCPHPCEEECRRALADSSVKINILKRFVADYEMNSGRRLPIPRAPSSGKKVAVIGGGPSGLSCAYFLARAGHEVTIFESMPELGGMLRYGIPEYRLPKAVLDWEIKGILNLGVKAHTHLKLGTDFYVGSLVAAGFSAIFIGIGAWIDYKLGIEGDDLAGCYTGINFLVKIGKKDPVEIPEKAAVIGGGNTAIDCARTLIRLGVKEVSIVYRRTRNEMPANPVEIEAAVVEGINHIFLAAPVRVEGDENGHVRGLVYQKMKLGEPDRSGRKRPVPIEGTETLLETDMLITAIGQSPDISFKEEGRRLNDLEYTVWNTLVVNPQTFQTNIPYIFSAGDAATGPSLVVDAIGGGRRAARSIHQYLTSQPVMPPPGALFKRKIPESVFESISGVGYIENAATPELPVDERIRSFAEVEMAVDRPGAQKESLRCLNCCRSCYSKEAL